MLPRVCRIDVRNIRHVQQARLELYTNGTTSSGPGKYNAQASSVEFKRRDEYYWDYCVAASERSPYKQAQMSSM